MQVGQQTYSLSPLGYELTVNAGRCILVAREMAISLGS